MAARSIGRSLSSSIDAALARREADDESPEDAGQIGVDGELIAADVHMGGRWHCVMLRPWGDKLRLAGDDPIALRQLFADLGLSIDGVVVPLQQLCDMDDCEVLALAYALLQVAAETIMRRQRDDNAGRR